MDLLRKSRILLMVCCVFNISITAGAVAIFVLTFGLNYSLAHFFLFGNSWTTIWGIWCFNVCIPIYYFGGYFFIICYHLKQRLNSIRIRLNIIRIKSKSLISNEKILMIRKLLKQHNELCQRIYWYNKYWKKYLTIFYLVFLTIICILSYVVLISSGLKWFLRIEYAAVLSAHSLLIFIITYSASSVSHFNLILYRDFCSFNVENYLPIDIKMKVKLKMIKKLTKNINLKSYLR